MHIYTVYIKLNYPLKHSTISIIFLRTHDMVQSIVPYLPTHSTRLYSGMDSVHVNVRLSTAVLHFTKATSYTSLRWRPYWNESILTRGNISKPITLTTYSRLYCAALHCKRKKIHFLFVDEIASSDICFGRIIIFRFGLSQLESHFHSHGHHFCWLW